jgi:fructokinase
MTAERPLLAGVELGGTKCICILGTGPDDIREQIRIPTAAPDVTLADAVAVLDSWHAKHGVIASLGIASFGPLDLRFESPTYGHVTSSVKPGWQDVDVVARLAGRRRLPVGFNTDVNGAALAEGRWGAARGLTDYAYVTVGTGIGVGVVAHGRLVLGCSHSELGHIRVARAAGDSWPGVCPYHGDCAEGLASGPAIAARTGVAAGEIGAANPVWDFVAHTLGQLLHTMVFATAPQRILIGGGVMEGHPELLPMARAQLVASVNGFIDVERLSGGVARYVAAPGLGPLAGPLGALALAADAASEGHAGAQDVRSSTRV